MSNRAFFWVVAFALAGAFSGCSVIPVCSYTNIQKGNLSTAKSCIIAPTFPSSPTSTSAQASFKIRVSRVGLNGDTRCGDPKKQKNVLVLLALSGGGSRAAYLSALAMRELEKRKVKVRDQVTSNLLDEVDAISSVSGGSLAAAYYASSGDPGCPSYSGRTWNDDEISRLMTRDYLWRWIGNWFWPTNLFGFWLTDYDRTDIMAQTLADNMYDQKISQYRTRRRAPYITIFDNDIDFSQLNPRRPNLILNATRGSWSSHDDNGIPFGAPFTFTAEDFRSIDSSIDSYKIARAVMASAAFPGAFNFMTLRDFADQRKEAEYLHVFDGGTSDNLGLSSLKRVIWESMDEMESEHPKIKPRNIITILVDAYTRPRGADPAAPDPRNAVSYIVDTNFMDAMDSLLAKNRRSAIVEYEKGELFPYGEMQFSEALSARAPGCVSEATLECEAVRANITSELDESCLEFFHWRGDRKAICARKRGWWDTLNKDIHDRLLFIHFQFEDVGPFTRSSDSPTGVYTERDFRVFAKHGRWPEAEPPGMPCDRLCRQLNTISTSFKFDSRKSGETQLKPDEAIRCAVPAMFGEDKEQEYECRNTKGELIGKIRSRANHAVQLKKAIAVLRDRQGE